MRLEACLGVRFFIFQEPSQARVEKTTAQLPLQPIQIDQCCKIIRVEYILIVDDWLFKDFEDLGAVLEHAPTLQRRKLHRQQSQIEGVPRFRLNRKKTYLFRPICFSMLVTYDCEPHFHLANT